MQTIFYIFILILKWDFFFHTTGIIYLRLPDLYLVSSWMSPHLFLLLFTINMTVNSQLSSYHIIFNETITLVFPCSERRLKSMKSKFLQNDQTPHSWFFFLCKNECNLVKRPIVVAAGGRSIEKVVLLISNCVKKSCPSLSSMMLMKKTEPASWYNCISN